MRPATALSRSADCTVQSNVLLYNAMYIVLMLYSIQITWNVHSVNFVQYTNYLEDKEGSVPP